jgi:hypothetical protein
MTSEDRIRIRHMLDAIMEALAFTLDKGRVAKTDRKYINCS